MPCNNKYGIFDDLEEGVPLTVIGSQKIVNAKADTQILATVTLPYTDPADSGIFASIHSNPPGINTKYPAITLREVGKGKVIWCAAPIEKSTSHDMRTFYYRLTKFLAENFTVYSDAPAPVEVLAYERKNAASVYLLNQQDYEPLVKAHNINIKIKTHTKPSQIILLPENKNIDFIYNDGFTTFNVDCLDIWCMADIKF